MLKERPVDCSDFEWKKYVDRTTLLNSVISESKVHLEWGSGETTVLASKLPSMKKIYSIDSCLHWIEEARKQIDNTKVTFYYIDIGIVDKFNWGYPTKGTEKFNNYKVYSQGIFKKITPEEVDTVLVDGRFRAACCLKSIEVFHGTDTKILFDDFWDRLDHPGYKRVLDYLDVIDKGGTLGVFNIKKDIDIEQVRADYEQYKDEIK